MSAVSVRETTTEFVILGKDIQMSLQKRITRHSNETDKCLTTISTMLKDKSKNNPELIAEQAAALMLALESEENIVADAIVVKTNIKRASYLSKESLDLSCIAHNLDSDGIYKVTLEEAKRYGLV